MFLEHYPTQLLKVAISGHPLQIQVTLIGLVNCSSSERCTPLSGIREKLNHRKACEASRATGDLLQQHKCRDELKTSSECQQLDLEVSLVHPVWLHLLYGTDVQVSTTT